MKSEEKGSIFYVYELRTSCGATFYVGKGCKNRMRGHRYTAKNERFQTRLYRKIRKIWRNGDDYIEVKIAENLSETDAHALEIQKIAHYGRSSLTNLTDGGEGNSGAVFTEERRKRISEKLKGRKCSPEVVEAMCNRRAGGPSPEMRKRISDKLKGRKLSEEHVSKMRGRVPDPEVVLKVAKANTGKKRTDELKARMSEKMKGRVIKEEWKQKMSEAHKGKTLPESTKEKLRAIMVERSRNPEWREHLSRVSKGRKMSDETKEKLRVARTGKKLSEDHRRKLSEAKKGLKLTDEHKAKLSKSYNGNQWGKQRTKYSHSDTPFTK